MFFVVFIIGSVIFCLEFMKIDVIPDRVVVFGSISAFFWNRVFVVLDNLFIYI
jgi:hypothetical protein